MLTREQLEDAAKCGSKKSCSECSVYYPKTSEHPCIEQVAKTALALMDEVERLIENTNQTGKVVLRLGTQNKRLEQENERLRAEDIPIHTENNVSQCWSCKNRVGEDINPIRGIKYRLPECRVTHRYMTKVYDYPCREFEAINKKEGE